MGATHRSVLGKMKRGHDKLALENQKLLDKLGRLMVKVEGLEGVVEERDGLLGEVERLLGVVERLEREVGAGRQHHIVPAQSPLVEGNIIVLH